MSEYSRRSDVSIHMNSDEEVTSRKELFPNEKRAPGLLQYVSDTDESKEDVETLQIEDLPISTETDLLNTSKRPTENRRSHFVTPPSRKKRRTNMSSIFRKSIENKRKEGSPKNLKPDQKKQDLC
ncbi:hypothetical protein ACFE04_011886 [Oxalis oulophora]